jgi:hypothetical protein
MGVIPFLAGYTGPATGADTSGERDLPDQPWRTEHSPIVAWAVVPAGQLRNVGIELIYPLYELAYANPLGLLEHIRKVVLFLLCCIVGKHSEKVEHNTIVE